MPRIKKPKSLDRESEEVKRELAEETKKVMRTRRKGVARKIKPGIQGHNPNWAQLSPGGKLEIVMTWSVNGGTVYGYRYSRHKLRLDLDITERALEEMINTCERRFLKIYDESKELGRMMAKAVTKVHFHLEEDRGRVVAYVEAIERERARCLNEIETATKSVPRNPKAVREKRLLISRFWQIFVDLGTQQSLALNALNQHTMSELRFIETFKKGIPESGDAPEQPKEQILTQAEAWKLIEEKGAQILPSQKAIDGREGSRDPEAAFAELKGQDV